MITEMGQGWRMSAWEIVGDLIMTDNTVVGSIIESGGSWSVEIMWGGPGGDIKYVARDHPCAVAFIDGVERTMAAFQTGSAS